MNQLTFLKGFVRKTKKRSITVVDTRGNKTVIKYSSSVRGGGGMINIVKVEICRPVNVVDVRLIKD